MSAVLFSFLTPTPFQIIFVLILGVLFFGKNLPEVAKQFGGVLGEFRKWMGEFKNITNDILDGKEMKSLKEGLMKEDMFDDKPMGEKYETAGTKFVPPQE
ncbi:MAG: twin-arginine translocase TatA/TatE family subunit [Planctomycetaceae bacterium]|nr:twin-arginine translocase TatA/TatE family subunit [Planctomycetaceae bacterium]